MTRWEQDKNARVFHAGAGEWYNQPHDKRWGMAEDAQPLPSPSWHIELEKGCMSLESPAPPIVVDVSEMAWLVGNDWGFLVQLGESLAMKDARLVVVASERVQRAGELVGARKFMKLASSLEEAF
jgi:hypothetical protein